MQLMSLMQNIISHAFKLSICIYIVMLFLSSSWCTKNGLMFLLCYVYVHMSGVASEQAADTAGLSSLTNLWQCWELFCCLRVVLLLESCCYFVAWELLLRVSDCFRGLFEGLLESCYWELLLRVAWGVHYVFMHLLAHIHKYKCLSIGGESPVRDVASWSPRFASLCVHLLC